MLKNVLAQNSALNLAAVLIQQQQQQNTSRFPAPTGANFPQAQTLARNQLNFPFDSQPNQAQTPNIAQTQLNWHYANKNPSSTPSLRSTSPIQQLGIDNYMWSPDVNHLVASAGCSLPNNPLQLLNEQLTRGASFAKTMSLQSFPVASSSYPQAGLGNY